MSDPTGQRGRMITSSVASASTASAVSSTQYPNLNTVGGKELYAFRYFAEKGLSFASAAGIVGNLWFESGQELDPRRDASICFKKGCGVGIGQWTTNTRQQSLTDFANLSGKYGKYDIKRPNRNGRWDYRVQVAFVWFELNEYKYGLFNMIDSNTLSKLRGIGEGWDALRSATRIFMKGFENPAKSVAHEYRRFGEAASVYARGLISWPFMGFASS